MDGALTTQPMALAVPPVRNTSASSMQSPPASADATSVSILSPVLARPGARPRSRCRSTSSGRPRCRPSVAGRISPALATRRWSSKAIWMRSGWSSASIFWVLLAWGRFPVSKGCCSRAGSFNNDELSKSVETALTQTRAQAVPATSDITRGADRLNENAACQGRHIQAEWHDVQRTLHAKRRLSM